MDAVQPWHWIALAWLASWLIFCRDKGYINRGPDKRPLGKVGGWLQSFFSWPLAWLRVGPLHVKIGTQMIALPPFVAFNWKSNKDGVALWRTLRLGWRYDVNARRYIFDVIVKLREREPLYF